MRTSEEIAGRIMYLERIKTEYVRHKEYAKVQRLERVLKELYWTLGVKIK